MENGQMNTFGSVVTGLTKYLNGMCVYKCIRKQAYNFSGDAPLPPRCHRIIESLSRLGNLYGFLRMKKLEK